MSDAWMRHLPSCHGSSMTWRVEQQGRFRDPLRFIAPPAQPTAKPDPWQIVQTFLQHRKGRMASPFPKSCAGQLRKVDGCDFSSRRQRRRTRRWDRVTRSGRGTVRASKRCALIFGGAYLSNRPRTLAPGLPERAGEVENTALRQVPFLPGHRQGLGPG